MRHLLIALLLISTSPLIKAEGLYILTPIASSNKNFPNIDVLFRLDDRDAPPTSIPSPEKYNWCEKQPETPERPGPDHCFEYDMEENKNTVKVLRQEILRFHKDTTFAYLLVRYHSNENYNKKRKLRISIDTGNGVDGDFASIQNAFENSHRSLAIDPNEYLDLDSDDVLNELTLKDADETLNSSYKRVRTALPSSVFSPLQDAQRSWIVFRDKECSAMNLRYTSDYPNKLPWYQKSEDDCRFELTAKRILQLNNIIGYSLSP